MSSELGSQSSQSSEANRGGRGFCAALLSLIAIAAVYGAPKLFRGAGLLSRQAQMRESVEEVVSGPQIQFVAISGVFMSGIKLPNEPFDITVDMIGVDTDVNGQGWSDAMRDESISHMQVLTAGRSISFEFDVERSHQTGKWPYLLAWIWADDLLLNAEMVRRGYLFVGDFGPNVKYRDVILEAEKEAMESGIERWSSITAP